MHVTWFRILLVIACCAPATVLSAQEATSNIARRQATRSVSAVEVKYDGFKDETTVKLNGLLISVKGRAEQKLSLDLEAKFKGERPPALGTLAIEEEASAVFTSVWREGIYPRQPELVIIIDGKRQIIEPSTARSDYSRLSQDKIITQTILTSVSAETLRRITDARTAEMKLGDTELVVDAATLEALRKFASATVATEAKRNDRRR
ncbi:MAG: hypothetical protein H0W76_10315 [Pyrinomonadaceae bacterium]|nr:hypothetical protein [Pyrinomonadaceae bacterium]